MLYRFREFEFDNPSRVLLRRGQEVPIGQLGIDLLLFLLENRDRVVGKDELRESIWEGRRTGASTIPTAINSLRQSLGDSPRESELIRTVYGRGYRWVAAVEVSKEGPRRRDETGRARRGFFGRSAELAELERLAASELEHASSALVAGGAGQGKSRLLEEFALLARRRGCAIALGQCPEVSGSPPFWPWIQVLRGVGCENLQEIRASVERMDTRSAEGADATRFVFFEGVARALEGCAATSPLIVLLDDIHAADLPSILLYEALTASLRPVGVRFVATLRRGDLLARGAAVSDRVLRTPSVCQIELSGLARADSRALVDSLAKFELTTAVLDALMERSGGNPFFLDQLVRQLNDPPIQGDCELAERLSSTAPGIKTSTEACLRSIPASVRMVLCAAAVAGREFDLGVLQRLTGLREAALLNALDQAVSRGLVRSNGGIAYSFSHVLVRDALYEGLDPKERSRLHAAVVAALREIHGVLTGAVACEAARHSVGVLDVEDPAEALELLSEAARWSEVNLGYEEAARYLQSALDVLDRGGRGGPIVRADILIRLAAAQRRSGRALESAATSRKAAELARRCHEPRLLARAALGYAPGFFAIEAGVVDEYLIAALEEAWAVCDQCDPGMRARILGRLAIALYWSDRHSECAGLADQAIKEAAQCSEVSAKVFAATSREVACWGPGNALGRAELAKNAIDLAEAAGDREMELVYRLFRLTSLLQVGRFSEVQQELAEFSKRAVASLNTSALWYRDLFGALFSMIGGDWERAEELTTSFEELGQRVSDRNADNCVVIHNLYRHIECGDPRLGLKLAEEQSKKFPRLKAYDCARIFFAAASGETSLAERMFRRLVEPGCVRLTRNAEWLVSMGLLAESCALLRDRRRAKTLFHELAPHEDEYLVVVFSVAVWRPVSFFLARLATTAGAFAEAERLFLRAEDQSQRLNARPWLAHAQMGHAELLRKRADSGDGKRARELALSAEDHARELEMRPLLARAKSFLWGPQRTA